MNTKLIKLLLKKFPYTLSLIILGLFFIGPVIFAQEPTDQNGNQETQIQEEHDTKNLNKILKDYSNDQEKVIKDANTIQEMGTSGELSEKEIHAVIESNPNEVSAAKNAERIDPQTLKKMKHSDALRVALAPLQKMSENQLVTILKENTKGGSAEVYVERFPKLSVFVVRLIKDAEALPMLAKILDDQDKLIRFGGIMLLTVLFGFFLKRFMKKEGRSILEAIGFWFFRFLIMTSLRFGILIYFYGKEIEPTFSVAYRTFL